MKVILLQDVKTLGKKGEVVEISEGYARNFVLKKKLGIEATASNMNDLKLHNANNERIAREKLAAANELKAKLSDLSVTLSIKTGAGGKVFGSISAKEVAQAIKDQLKMEIDKKKIVLAEPIKSLGTHVVKIKLHPEVTASLDVHVTEEK